jgi:cytochrome P450
MTVQHERTGPSAGCPVRDFDHHTIGFADRIETWRELRDLGPVFRSTRFGGFWVVSRRQETAEVLLDAETWSSARTADGGGGQAIPSFMWSRPNMPGEYDGEPHQRYRRGFATFFTPKRVAARRSDIERLVDGVFDETAGRTQIDGIHDIAVPVPSRTILSVLGMDLVDAQWMGTVAQEILNSTPDSPRAAEIGAQLNRIEDRVLEAVADRRAHPREDIMTSYATLTDETGELLGREDLLSVLVSSFMFGGLVTAAEVIANAVLLLGADRDLRQRLIDDPDLVPGFANDMVRYVTPASSVARTATRDTVLGGQAIKAGDRVLLMLAAANHDEREFGEPEAIVPDRPTNQHVGFGLGPHFCPGAPLARLEIELATSGLLTHYPDFRLADPDRAADGVVGPDGGWARLPVFTS